jgi:serine/threonine protein kinase
MDAVDDDNYEQLLLEAAGEHGGRRRTALDTLCTAARSGQLRDVQHTLPAARALLNVVLSPYAHEADNAATDSTSSTALWLLLVASSFPEVSSALAAAVPAASADELAGAILARLLTASEAAHVRASGSMRGNMGLVSFATTGKGPATGVHAGRGPSQVGRRPAPVLQELAGLRAALLWIVVTWPVALPVVLRRVMSALRACGRDLEKRHCDSIRALLQVLLAVVSGSPDVHVGAPAAAAALLALLSPLRAMPGMVTDTGSALGVFHPVLLRLTLAATAAHPQLLADTVDDVLRAWDTASQGTSAAALLLMHEADVLTRAALEACEPSLDRILSRLLPVLMHTIESDNSRAAQMGLAFLRHPPFLKAVAARAHRGGQLEFPARLLVSALLRGGKRHWNDTVNRQTGAALAALAAACPALVEAVVGGTPSLLQPQVAPGPTPAPTSGAGRTPGPAIAAAAKKGSAEWSMTVTGVAPWASAPPAVVHPKLLQQEQARAAALTHRWSKLETSAHVAAAEEPASVLRAFIASLLPADVATSSSDGEGGGPVLHPCLTAVHESRPMLAFHDLVFGRELGAGAFATVLYARAVTRGASDASWPEYAVKVLQPATLIAQEYARAAERELAVLRALRHPNTARLVSAFRWREGAYLVLEYGGGGDLHTAVTRRGGLPEAAARALCGEVLAALLAVHALGLVYGDVKPENVVLVTDGTGGSHAKLVDFAACRAVSPVGEALLAAGRGRGKGGSPWTALRDGAWRADLDGAGQRAEGTAPASAAAEGEHEAAVEQEEEDERVEGTEEFLPPEAFRAGMPVGRPSAAGDAYALGLTLYQCLRGSLPSLGSIWPGKGHAGGGRGVAFSQVGAQAFPADFPPLAEELIRALVHPDPTQRLGGGAEGLAEVAAHAWWAPLGDLNTLHARAGPVLGDDRLLAPLLLLGAADPAWARRHNSSIWAPLPAPPSYSSEGKEGAGPQTRRRAADFTPMELAAMEELPPL